MIPKIVHYVWLGKGEKPKKIRRCIQSWKANLPEYQFVEWNETNFSIQENEFAYKAYKKGYWAFVSDYIRVAVIKKYGGIYLDTDVIVLDDLNEQRKNDFFLSSQSVNQLSSAVLGAVPNHPLVSKMERMYNNFDFDENKIEQFINTKLFSQALVEYYQCKLNDQKQYLKDGICIYPSNILCNPSKYSKAIHLRNGSWTKNQSLITNIGIELRGRITNKFEARVYSFLKSIQTYFKGI